MVESGVHLIESRVEREREVAALFDRHYAPLCRLAYVILGDAGLAEEIVMDALLKTYNSWGGIRDHARTDSYLRRAVVNLCRSKIRRRVIERRVNQETYKREERRAPAWDAEVHETRRLVWEAIKSLPERQRATVVLRYFEDRSEAEIAEILDCAQGTVKSQLSKARAKLERELLPQLAAGRDA